MLQEAGAMVVLTHDVLDVNISNIQRAQMFNEAQVDLGIRIHCNNGGSERKYTGAFMLVPTENRTKFYEQNVEAAKTILAAYCEETGLPTRYKDGITYRSDQTGFNWCERPIVTIEMGHLSNPAEDALLSDPEFQVKMARGLFNGILRYFRPDLVAAANE
jgi:N-acetylmuramoyl-L-alanine amidase